MIIESFNLMLTPLCHEKQDSGGIVIISVTAGQYKDLLYTLSRRMWVCVCLCLLTSNIIPTTT